MAGLLSISLLLITYLVGTVKPHHAHTHTSTHRDTCDLCSMQSLGTGRPHFVTTAGDWRLVVYRHQPVHTPDYLRLNKQTTNKHNTKSCVRKKCRLKNEKSKKKKKSEWRGRRNWHSMHWKCERSHPAHWRHHMGHRCVIREKSRACLTYLPLSSTVQSGSSGRLDPCSCFCPHRWCTSSPSRWPKRGGWNWANQ